MTTARYNALHQAASEAVRTGVGAYQAGIILECLGEIRELWGREELLRALAEHVGRHARRNSHERLLMGLAKQMERRTCEPDSVESPR